MSRERKPVIGIVMPRERIATGAFLGSWRVYCTAAYPDGVVKAGGIPVTLPLAEDEEVVAAQVAQTDGIILCGGADIDAHLYGEEPHVKQGHFDRVMDLFYLHAIRQARAQNKPVFGICRGIQAINVAYGGTLYQDLPAEYEGAGQHSQTTPACMPCHYVTVAREGFFADLYPEKTEVNSFHHQGLKQVGEGLIVRARSTEGIPEAVEGTCSDGKTPVIGVQWHPEMMLEGNDPQSLALFKKFVNCCAKSESGVEA